MSMTNRLFLYGPFALFVVLVVAVSLRWWIEADAFSKRLDAMNGRRIAPGVTLHFAQKRIAGFPFRLDATFNNVDVQIDTPHGPSHWQASEFALHRLTYGARKTLFESAGRQRLNWTSEDGRHHELPFESGSMRASAIEDDGGVSRFDLGLVSIGTPEFTAGQAQFHVRRDPQNDALDLSFAADSVRIVSPLRAAFGDRIKSLKLSATLVPGKTLARLRAGEMAWPDSLRAFARANGSVHVDSFEIVFNQLSAVGHGSFGVDSGSRPRGLLDLRIGHLDRFLTATGRSYRHGLAAALDAVAKKDTDEEGRRSVVFTCSDGITYLGDQPIGVLGTLL